jgi:NADH dehydrogenase
LSKSIHHKVIIIGGGFGGLYAAKAFRGEPVQVTLIDRRNFHLFQPLLYQVATGGLSPADIAFPLRAIFRRQHNVKVLLDNVTDIDFTNQQVHIENNMVSYDSLIIAAGSHHNYFGNSQWEKLAPGLKTVEDATDIRSRILKTFEKAEMEDNPDKRQSFLTFVIIGGGPAGVEMAGAIAELSRHTLLHDFRTVNPKDARIFLIEGSDRILPPYPEILSTKARKTLERLGVEILTNSFVTDISESGIEYKTQNIKIKLACGVAIWTAGVQASTLAKMISKKLNVNLDKAGRLIVNNYCSLEGHENVFVIGDLAHFEDTNGQLLTGTATVAMQQGRYVARKIITHITGNESAPFKYIDKGNLAVIGRKSAVAFRKKVRFSGLPAWILWLFVHLLYLVGFENRILVAVQWAFNYFTFNRSARLITGMKNSE